MTVKDSILGALMPSRLRGPLNSADWGLAAVPILSSSLEHLHIRKAASRPHRRRSGENRSEAHATDPRVLAKHWSRSKNSLSPICENGSANAKAVKLKTRISEESFKITRPRGGSKLEERQKTPFPQMVSPTPESSTSPSGPAATATAVTLTFAPVPHPRPDSPFPQISPKRSSPKVDAFRRLVSSTFNWWDTPQSTVMTPQLPGSYVSPRPTPSSVYSQTSPLPPRRPTESFAVPSDLQIPEVTHTPGTEAALNKAFPIVAPRPPERVDYFGDWELWLRQTRQPQWVPLMPVSA